LNKGPTIHGWCLTNLGKGGVFDLIRDHDGTCSETLASHVAGKARLCLTATEIVAQLTALYHHLLEHRILVSDPALHNIVVHYPQPQRPTLVIIDGVGNSNFIKIADYHKASAHRWIKKKWRRYIEVSPLLTEVFQATGYRPMTL
jgi:hypothetical protein